MNKETLNLAQTLGTSVTEAALILIEHGPAGHEIGPKAENL